MAVQNRDYLDLVKATIEGLHPYCKTVYCQLVYDSFDRCIGIHVFDERTYKMIAFISLEKIELSVKSAKNFVDMIKGIPKIKEFLETK